MFVHFCQLFLTRVGLLSLFYDYSNTLFCAIAMEIKVKSHRNILYRTSIKGHTFLEQGKSWVILIHSMSKKKLINAKGRLLTKIISTNKQQNYKMISNSVYFQQSSKVSYDFLSPKEKLVKNIS